MGKHSTEPARLDAFSLGYEWGMIAERIQASRRATEALLKATEAREMAAAPTAWQAQPTAWQGQPVASQGVDND
jgi:hypothetical protein